MVWTECTSCLLWPLVSLWSKSTWSVPIYHMNDIFFPKQGITCLHREEKFQSSCNIFLAKPSPRFTAKTLSCAVSRLMLCLVCSNHNAWNSASSIALPIPRRSVSDTSNFCSSWRKSFVDLHVWIIMVLFSQSMLINWQDVASCLSRVWYASNDYPNLCAVSKFVYLGNVHFLL